MKFYKLDAFCRCSDIEYTAFIVTDRLYFPSLHLALAYLQIFCDSSLSWAISLYHGFQFDRFIARGSYD